MKTLLLVIESRLTYKSRFGLISVFLLAALLKLEIMLSMLSLALIASPFRVTVENLVFETVQSGPYSFLNVFFALKGTHFYISLLPTNIYLRLTLYT